MPNVGTSIETKRRNRKLVLSALYQISNQFGATYDVVVPAADIGSQIELSVEDVEDAAKFLVAEGLMRHRGMGSRESGFSYSITHGGVSAVEEEEKPASVQIQGRSMSNCLLMGKAKANEELGKRLASGRTIRERMKMMSPAMVNDVNSEYQRWDSFNVTLLARIFPTDVVSLQYQNTGGPDAVIDVYDSGGLLDRLATSLEEKINFLQSQLEQLDLYDEPVPSQTVADIKITKEGAFFKGQTFDAMAQIIDIFKLATKSIDLIDGYADDTVLKMLTSKSPSVNVRVLIFPQAATPALQAMGTAFKSQWGHIEIKSSKAFHDRFILIDRTDLYHLGTSINSAGKKGFMFSRVEEPTVLKAIITEWDNEWARANTLV